MALHCGQDRLALLQAETQCCCGMPGWDALARADLVPLRRAVSPGQLQHDLPPHRVPAPQPPPADIAPPRSWTVSAAQYRIRPRARALCSTYLDCHDLHYLTAAHRQNPNAVRDLFAYRF